MYYKIDTINRKGGKQMKNKALMGLIATATIGTVIATPAIMNNQNTTHIVNKVLMVSNKKTNEAVVINGNSNANQLKIN